MYLDELQQQLLQLRNLSSWMKAHLRDGHHSVTVVGLFVEDRFKKLSLRGVAATPLSLHFLSMEYWAYAVFQLCVGSLNFYCLGHTIRDTTMGHSEDTLWLVNALKITAIGGEMSEISVFSFGTIL
ncbi:hypothetical protein F5876DRAFT_62232 [Lentinula aff. lateritia]|uniref:Uncharacterized protein n=1 Tax=Lentinula aff. lateritia TaxID=2804960 RepID=A0ACC1UC63_9AGAR|nr:hypothetical protein F5876DRAFT_62232 [Lentinula aff. lateritia]